MKSCTENGVLVIFLEGRIDSSNARSAEEEIGRLIGGPDGRDFLFDAEKLTYISSAGLRILLGVYQRQKRGFVVRNVSPEVYEVMDMTGFNTFLTVKKKPRAVSVEGCPMIGRGAIGTVYRLDEDTIVKVYAPEIGLPVIEKEQSRSRQAFLKGIPTAIPFDIVRVGDGYGSVFEMIKAKSCNDILVEQPERLEEMTDLYAAFLRHVHSVPADPGELPDAREEYASHLDTLRGFVPDKTLGRVRDLIREMPEDMHIIHGDIHLKNVLFSGGDMILIDMETLSHGNPVFEMAGLYMTYVIFNEDEPDNTTRFLGLSGETCGRLFYGMLRKYLNARDEEEYHEKLDRITLLGYVRFLYVLSLIGGGKPECREKRIQHSRERLTELCARVKSLAI